MRLILNIAIIEYLLKKKFGVLYGDLINKGLESKIGLLQDYLVSGAPSSIPSIETSRPSETDLDLLNDIKSKVGLDEPDIRQRLLNNLPILETLLLILGQSYADTVSSSLFDKQNTLNGLGTTNKLLELLQSQRYGIGQLKKIISSSNSILPIKINFVPANIIYDYTIQHQPVEQLPSIKLEPKSAILGKEDYGADLFFSPQDYDRIMKVIEKVDQSTYDFLQECFGYACVQKCPGCEIAQVIPQNIAYLIIKLPEDYLKLPESLIEDIMRNIMVWVRLIVGTALTPDDRKKVMQIIESVAPIFYSWLIKVDPNGEYHLKKFDDLMAIKCSSSSYLPIILAGKEFFTLPENQQRFVIAHELGHYVLGHLTDNPLPLPLKEAWLGEEGASIFKKAYSRDKEYEADRFAVVNLGIPIADGVAWMKSELEKTRFDYDTLKLEKETFKSTHPLWMQRIKHLESLASEAELCRQGKIPCSINWEKAFDACYYKFESA